MEEALEEKQTIGVELNYEVSDLDLIFDELLNNDSIGDDIKKKLYYLQSDQ